MPPTERRRVVPAQHHQSILLRQPLFWSGRYRSRDWRGATPGPGVTAVNVRRVMLVTVRILCVCRYRTGVIALHGLRQSFVQTACPERTPLLARIALAGDPLAGVTASPGHRVPGPKGWGKMQGKIKGRGTMAREMSVCTWGGHGTCQGRIACLRKYRGRVSAGMATCHLRSCPMVLAGVAL